MASASHLRAIQRQEVDTVVASQTKCASSFKQGLLWSVLDQDALPDILNIAHEYWDIDAAA